MYVRKQERRDYQSSRVKLGDLERKLISSGAVRIGGSQITYH